MRWNQGKKVLVSKQLMLTKTETSFLQKLKKYASFLVVF